MTQLKSIQRNPFFDVIKQETPKFGFKYKVEPGQSVHELIIFGLHNGKEATLKYPFPRICRSFESTKNFRSKLIRFLRDYTREVGFISPDPYFQPAPERKSTFVQKAYKEPEKKVLTTPHPVKVQMANIEKSPAFVTIMPYIPSSYVGDDKKPAKPNEPLSTTKSLAMFLVDNVDLSTLMELMNGLAIYRGSKPAPLRITGEQQTSVIAQQPTSVPPPPPVLKLVEPVPAPRVSDRNELTGGEKLVMMVVDEMFKPKKKPRVSGMGQIADRILSDPTKVWRSTDFMDIMDKKNSIQATLSLLVTAHRIVRVGQDQYNAPKSKKQVTNVRARK